MITNALTILFLALWLASGLFILFQLRKEKRSKP